MKDWYSSIYKAFIIAAIISFIIGFFTEGKTSLGSFITGYSVLILGIMMILLILFNGIMKVTSGQTMMQTMYTFLFTTGPFLLMLGVISFILYLLITYKAIILDNHVSKSYYSFSNITIILIFIQLYIVYTNITTNNFETSGKFSKVTSSMVYLLGVLSAISSIILFTILKYFTTDGFSTYS